MNTRKIVGPHLEQAENFEKVVKRMETIPDHAFVRDMNGSPLDKDPVDLVDFKWEIAYNSLKWKQSVEVTLERMIKSGLKALSAEK